MGIRHVKFEDGFGVARLRKCAAVAAWLLISIITGATPVFAVDYLIDHFIDSDPSKGHDPVLTGPSIYITYWGSDWSNGFMTYGVSSNQYQFYLENFLDGIGGGNWIGTQMQYRGAGNPPGVVKGTWIDSIDPVNQTPTPNDLNTEALRSMAHFGFSAPTTQAVFIIALAPGYGDTAFVAKGGPFCAWHSATNYTPFIIFPFQPDAPMGCGQFSVNPFPNDLFGHGVFDGVSIVAGHEWAETLTDPLTRGGWYGQSGLSAETGDKCAWDGNLADISAGGTYYAIQSLWSNNDSKCVWGAAPSLGQSPTSTDFGVAVRYSTSDPVTIQLTNNGDLDAFLWTEPYITGADYLDFQLSGNTCGKGQFLRPGDSCQFDVTFRPTALGLRQAVVGVNATDPAYHFIATPSTTLSGEGIPQWAVFDPNSIIFGGVLIRSTAPSPELPIALDNIGDNPRLIQRVRLGGPHPSDFLILSDGCSDHELGPSVSCEIVLGFAPTATGERQAELEFQTMDVTGAPGETLGIPVLGTGLGPVAQLSTTRLSFGDFQFKSGGAATGGEIPVEGEVLQEITFTNTGQSPLEVQSAEVSGDFVLANNGCSQPLQPNDSCVIQVRLTPTHFQMQSGTLMIDDNTSDSPHEVKLTGSVGAPMASLIPDGVQFGPVPVGITSSPQTVQLGNPEGDVALHIQSIAATGDFTATSDCPSVLLIGNCTITVTLKPTAAGPRNGMLVVTDDALGSPQQIPLVGTGCAKGDLNCDGDVDLDDLNILLSYKNQPASACPACDLDGDGMITALDARKLVLLCTRPRCATQ